MPRANWSVLKAYPCRIPPSPLLTQFNEIMGDTVDLLKNLVRRKRNMSATRDLLLPRLLSGEIDVSSLPLEPTAS
jgi:type I restriction enzyme S subunit